MSTRLSGHALRSEGAAFAVLADESGTPERLAGERIGSALCECGAVSERLYSANARKRWHRSHKAAVLAARPS